MKSLFLFCISLVISLGAFAQRDTIINKKLYFLEPQYGEGVVYRDSVWSNDYADYFNYSRIDMGNRMNFGIEKSKLAEKQFWMGIAAVAVGSGWYIKAAYNDPVIWVESSKKWDRSYYNDAKDMRSRDVIIGSAFMAAGAYLFWRSHKNNRKSRWFISPDGIRYKF